MVDRVQGPKRLWQKLGEVAMISNRDMDVHIEKKKGILVLIENSTGIAYRHSNTLHNKSVVLGRTLVCYGE